MSVVVHGDDLTALGTDEALNAHEAALAKSFVGKRRGRLGFGAEDSTEMRLLNNIVRVQEDGVRYETDPRHAELQGRALLAWKNAVVHTPLLAPRILMTSSMVRTTTRLMLTCAMWKLAASRIQN